MPRPAFLRPAGTATRALTYWHLLSLDAPTVATLWMVMVSASARVRLPVSSLAAMFLAVWILYAADRLLDAHPLHQQPVAAEDLEARHLFHHRYRRAFLLGITAAAALLAVLLPRLNPVAVHLDLTLGSLLAGYFILIHTTSPGRRLPKEFAVGLFFSAAVFIPTVARHPDLHTVLAPAACLFAALCCLNCVCIHAWEHECPSSIHASHRLTRAAVAGMLPAAFATLAAALLLALFGHQPIGGIIGGSTALSAGATLALHRWRHSLSPITLRACADLALLSPCLLLPWVLR